MIKKQKLFKVQIDITETRRRTTDVLAESEEHVWEKIKQNVSDGYSSELLNMETETKIFPVLD